MRADRAQGRRRPAPGHLPALRRLPVTLVLALVTVVGAGNVAVAPAAPPATMPASSAPALSAAPATGGLPSAATEAPRETPEDDDEPTVPETDEGTTEGEGPQPVVWFLAAAALLALALGFVVMTRNQRTRG